MTNAHDITEVAALIREDDEVVYGASGYLGIQKRPKTGRMRIFQTLIFVSTAAPAVCPK